MSAAKWFSPIIAIIALTNIATLLDIPILRQMFGFIFLTFIPGFLLLCILKLNRPGLVEKIVLSVGLSVGFLMLFGLAASSLLLALGYTKPLSTTPLLLSFSIAIIILAIIAYIRNRNITFSFSAIALATREKAFLIVPAFFPLLSIVGMRIMNLTDNNALLMFLLFLIPAYVIFVSFYRHKVPQKLYPSLIYLISISLLLMLSLRSNHLIGSDIHDWYYLFQSTMREGHFGLFAGGVIDSSLSISLLPTIYQSLMNIDTEYLFKILYPLLFSISPLVLYIISKKYIGSFYAFLASFFFMAQFTFLWTAGISNTNLAILFFALAIMVLFHQDIGELPKRLLFIIFIASSIVSHYSTSYIFFFVLLLTWIGMQIVPRFLRGERKVATPSENPVTGGAPSNSPLRGVMPSSNANASNTSQSATFDIPRSYLKGGITSTMVALFLVMLVCWYSQITIVPFNAAIDLIYQTFTNLHQSFLLEAKGPTIEAAMGEGIYTLPQQIRFVVSWLSVAFIAIGVLSTVARYKRIISVTKSADDRPDFVGFKFETGYSILAIACSTTLLLSVLLPYLMKGYSMERTYFQMLVVLSPFFVIGGIIVAQWLRARPHWIILVVLIPFFMCTAGTMSQIFGYPGSLVLNSVGGEYERWYVHDQDSYGAKWIKEYSKEGAMIYTGPWPEHRWLRSQGEIAPSQIMGSIVFQYQEGMKSDGYIFLRYKDVIDGMVMEYPDIFVGKNKIYATNGSAIYR